MKSNINLRIIDAIVTFDEYSTANIYHVQLLHDIDGSSEAIKCFDRAVKNLSELCVVCKSGDFATRFLVLSHVSPLCFEHLLMRNFIKYRTNTLFNIMF